MAKLNINKVCLMSEKQLEKHNYKKNKLNLIKKSIAKYCPAQKKKIRMRKMMIMGKMGREGKERRVGFGRKNGDKLMIRN